MSSEPIAEIEYTGYEPANSIRWFNGGLAYLDAGTKLYTHPSDDDKRMDFITAHPGWLQCNRRAMWYCARLGTNYEYPVFKTPREAIDWAIGEYGL
jgi:hypothetical protein